LWFTNYGVYLLERGRWAEAELVFQEGLEQNQQAGTDATLNAHVRLNFALLYYEWARYDESLHYAEEFLRVDLRKSTELTAGAALVGLIALDRGDTRTANAVSHLLRNISNFFGDGSYHQMLLARILVAEGRKDVAREHLATAYCRLRRRYYPAAARVQLEMLRLADDSVADRLIAFAAECERHGLEPLAERARVAALQPLIL
jgi:tetratricopeptide (TPR) repeat protein